MPARTLARAALAVDDAGERELAEYTFDHRPS